MQKYLITGITGFVGSHLTDYLLTLRDVEVHGVLRWRSRTEHIKHFSENIHLHECDVRDPSSVLNVIKTVKPDRIFHLAAQSYVPTSWSAPSETITTNILGSLNILEAIHHNSIDTRIQLACSSEEYGLVHENELPIKETNPLRPLSPYAVSKVGEDHLGFQYFMSYGIPIIRTRAFNHTGPRRGDVFVCSYFAKQIALMEKGTIEPVLKVGNLEAKRDFTDVRDMVKGYHLALEKGTPGEVYNICSGKMYSIQKILDMLLGMSSIKVSIVKDKEKLRPSDVPMLLGDSTKFRKATGWSTTFTFEQTLEDIMNYWRDIV